MTSTSNSSSYYDIDAILAEEELIPVVNIIDFFHLAHLDPNYVNPKSTSSSSSSSIQPTKQKHSLLLKKTKFKMPLWSIEKWSKLHYIQIYLPKHYNRKGRDKLEADPLSINLRSKSERFYMSGLALINLIYTCKQLLDREIQEQKSRRRINQQHWNTFNRNQIQFMDNLYNESLELKERLLLTYTGERLRRTFDWTLSYIDDDVSDYTKRLTVMEHELFQCSANASHAFAMWKMHGSRRICVSETSLRAGVFSCGNNNNINATTNTPGGGMASKRSSKSISPDSVMDASSKRMRSY